MYVVGCGGAQDGRTPASDRLSDFFGNNVAQQVFDHSLIKTMHLKERPNGVFSRQQECVWKAEFLYVMCVFWGAESQLLCVHFRRKFG